MMFIVCLYLYCRSRDNYQEGNVGIPLSGLILPHVGICSKAELGFSTSCLLIFFMLNVLKLPVIFRFVDIDPIDAIFLFGHQLGREYIL